MRASIVRRMLYVTALTLVWLLLWDRITVANAVGGVVVACVVLIVFPTASRVREARPAVIRPLPTMRLAGYVLAQLAVSNGLVAREILSPRSHVRTGIVACRLRTDSPGLVTLLANIVALSPGTMTVEVRAEPPTLYVHVLMLRDVAAARRGVAHLEHLVLRAFGTEDDRTRPAVSP